MDQNKISVIVPVYNTAAYLRACVESICTQTYDNLEILLINDGSTDCSGELCDELARQDSRIRVIHKHNMGVSAARNDGIDSATGAYFAFVDSDDVISNRMLDTLHSLACQNNADIAVCGIQRIQNQEDFSSEVQERKSGVFSRQNALRNFISTYGFGGFLCNKLFRAELFREPEPLRLSTDIYVCEDLLMTSLLIERANLVAFTETQLYGYLLRRESATETITEKTLTSLAAKRQMIDIYERNGLREGGSWYAYSLANLLTHCNSKVITRNFHQLLDCLVKSKKYFVPEIHRTKEKVLFYSVLLCPYVIPYVCGCLRTARRFFEKA